MHAWEAEAEGSEVRGRSLIRIPFQTNQRHTRSYPKSIDTDSNKDSSPNHPPLLGRECQRTSEQGAWVAGVLSCGAKVDVDEVDEFLNLGTDIKKEFENKRKGEGKDKGRKSWREIKTERWGDRQIQMVGICGEGHQRD